MILSDTVKQFIIPYPVQSHMPVQWGDMDANQHVNNVVYLRWSETGRTEYFHQLNKKIKAEEKHGFSPILANVQCKFIFPATHPDTIIIASRATNFKEDRLDIETLMVSTRHERVVALAAGTLVNYDYTTWKKKPFVDGIEDILKEFEASLP